MGAVPDWYGALTAARYLGVKPWELLEPAHQPWIGVALAAQAAERLALADRARNRKKS